MKGLHYISMLLLACLFALGGMNQVQAETLTVAVNQGDRPFGYLDDRGELTGFNVELAKALCNVIGADCRLEPVPFADFLPGVAKGRFAFAVANMLKTPEREKLVDFTDRIRRSSSTFVGRLGSGASVTGNALKGRTIAVQSGTAQERYLRATYGDDVKLLTFSNNQQRNQALADGKAELMLGAITACFEFLTSPEGNGFEIIGTPLYDQGLGGDVAIPVGKDKPALRNRLNEGIAQLLRDGTFARISNRYFPISMY